MPCLPFFDTSVQISMKSINQQEFRLTSDLQNAISPRVPPMHDLRRPTHGDLNSWWRLSDEKIPSRHASSRSTSPPSPPSVTSHTTPSDPPVLLTFLSQHLSHRYQLFVISLFFLFIWALTHGGRACLSCLQPGTSNKDPISSCPLFELDVISSYL